jgi:O-antigen ligase
VLSTRYTAAFVTLFIAGLGLGLSANYVGPVNLFLLVPVAIALASLPVVIAQSLGKLNRLWQRVTWVHWLWFLAILSSQVFRIRDTDSIVDAPLDAWAIFRIGLMLIVGIVLIARLPQTPWLGSLTRGLLGGLTIYAVFAVASTTWSVNPAWTFYKSTEYLVDLILLAALLTAAGSANGYKRVLDWMWLITGALVATVWVGVFLWPEQALVRGSDVLGPRISGVLPIMDQNLVGEYGAILAIVAATRLLVREGESGHRAFYFATLAVGLVTLVESQTRSAIVGFLIAFVVVLLLLKRRNLIVWGGAGLVAVVCLTGAGDWLSTAYLRDDHPQGLETVSGRLPRWEAGWASFLDRPIAGYGAFAAQRFAIGADIGDSELTDVLNTYLDVLLGTGIIGLMALVAVLIRASWWLLTAAMNPCVGALERAIALETIGVLTIEMARSLVSTKFVTHSALLGLVVIGYAEFLRRRGKASMTEEGIGIRVQPAPGMS